MLDKTTTLFSPDALIQWLRKQPAGEEYIWSDPVYCMMGRYLADNGSTWGVAAYSDMPHYHEIACPKPWTFGAALKRAEALLMGEPPTGPLGLLRGPRTAPTKQLPSPALQIEDRSHDLVPVEDHASRDVPH